MVLSLAPSVFAAGDDAGMSVSFDNTTPNPGDTITALVTVESDFSAAMAYESSFYFDKELLTVEKIEILGAPVLNLTTVDRANTSGRVRFAEMNNKTVFLVTVTGTPEEGKAFAYGENVMYKTTAYDENAYSWLVIVDGTADLTVEEATAKITQAAATAEEVAAGYDVNETGVVDINDAQLTYDIYTGKYTDFEKVSVRKFLRADTNADKVVNSADAVAVVANSN